MNSAGRFLPIVAIALLLSACAGGKVQGKRNMELIQASRQGNMGQVVTLISKGADINAIDPDGWTPYLAASAEGNWQIMKVLADMGAKTDPGF